MPTQTFVSSIHIENFKCFKGSFNLDLNEGLNILVGNNEAGKSTILEAINLALTGVLNGKYLKNDLTQYIFNNEVVAEYIVGLKNKTNPPPPHVLIELILKGENLVSFLGDDTMSGKKEYGVSFKIAFNEDLLGEYQKLVASDLSTIPIEYYEITWRDFSRHPIIPKTIPIKVALIDSSSHKYQNGSDIYISRIVKDHLEEEDRIKISQAHREMRDSFMLSDTMKSINKKIEKAAKISDKSIKLSVDLATQNAWENSLMTYLDDVPFHYIGKGEQCIIKTNLALGHKKSLEANILLLEEPENHLSHSKLNQLLKVIKDNGCEKQIIISTHSSFVANKLGLESLVFINDGENVKLDDLDSDTKSFFQKLSGYDTLRLILCKKAILVEGDSDELIVQKAFMSKNGGALPIEKGIDVISVGTTFLRFLEIAKHIKKPVSVVTDNDGKLDELKAKYDEYLGGNKKEFIDICFDEVMDSGGLEINGKKFNYNTLEPKLLKENSLALFNTIFGTSYKSDDEMHKFMKSNKTNCALKLFDTTTSFSFPDYILRTIS